MGRRWANERRPVESSFGNAEGGDAGALREIDVPKTDEGTFPFRSTRK